MSTRLAILFVLAFTATSRVSAQGNIWAQLPQCQVRSLFWETEATGVLDNSDCKTYVEPRGLLAAEYWDMALSAGDYVIVTVQRGSMQEPYAVIYDPGFIRVAADDELLPGSARVAFRAAMTGVYRAVVSSAFPETTAGSRYVHDTTRSDDRPNVQDFFLPSVLGSQVTLSWAPALSPTPILEYMIVIGSRPGASDVGRIPVGTATQVVASAGPGVYYVRIAARNSFGLGADSIEQVIHVGPALSAPRSLTASMVGRRVTFNWIVPLTGGATYYELLVGSMPGLTNIGTLIVGNITTFSVENVPPGVYYVRARAGNALGPGVESNEVVLVF